MCGRTSHQKNQKNYRMIDALPNISKAGLEYTKLIQHGCAIFVIWNIQMMSTAACTEIPIPGDIFFIIMLNTPIGTKYLTGTNPTGI